MKVLVFANQKGGVGKSTLAAHVSVGLERAGKGRVVLLDLDPQGSLSEWWNAREAAAPAYAQCDTIADLQAKLKALAGMGYAWCVIDTPPSVGPTLEQAARAADLIVVPIQATSFDVKAAPKTVELFQQLGRRFVFALNRVKGQSAEARRLHEDLAGVAPVFPVRISDRQIYGTVTQDGRTVFDLAGEAKVHAEQDALAAYLAERFDEYRQQPARREKAHAI